MFERLNGDGYCRQKFLPQHKILENTIEIGGTFKLHEVGPLFVIDIKLIGYGKMKYEHPSTCHTRWMGELVDVGSHN
jgi:hypothetical protein